MKNVLLNSCHIAKLKKELSTSQRQAVIKLIEKKDKDKIFIKLKIGNQFLYRMSITKLFLNLLHQGSKRSFLI